MPWRPLPKLKGTLNGSLSSEVTHTVEIWNDEKMVCWYFDGVKG
jgi:hypothetical protein